MDDDNKFVPLTVCQAQHKTSIFRAAGAGAAILAAIAMSTNAVTTAWHASYGVQRIQAVLNERSKAVDVQAATVKAQLDMLNVKLDRLSEEVRARLPKVSP